MCALVSPEIVQAEAVKGLKKKKGKKSADLFVNGGDEHRLELHARHLGRPEAEVEEH